MYADGAMGGVFTGLSKPIPSGFLRDLMDGNGLALRWEAIVR